MGRFKNDSFKLMIYCYLLIVEKFIERRRRIQQKLGMRREQNSYKDENNFFPESIIYLIFCYVSCSGHSPFLQKITLIFEIAPIFFDSLEALAPERSAMTLLYTRATIQMIERASSGTVFFYS